MRKRMKFWLIALVMLALCIGAISPTKVVAAESTYRLDDLELEITIPSGYKVVTKDTPDGDSIFGEIGMTKSDFVSIMESGSIYMELFPEDFTEEISVTMQPNDFPIFSSLSDEQLGILGEQFLNTDLSEQYGVDMDYSAFEIYQHAQAKFLKIYFSDATNSAYGLQYYTIYDGKAMNFTLRSYVGPITQSQENVMKSLVDSIKYDGVVVETDVNQNAEEFVYTNNESGVSFTVPQNWVYDDFYKEKEFLDVKFVHSMDSGEMIMFAAIDAWSELSEADRAGYNRTDFNSSLFSIDDAAMMYGLTGDEISKVTYNGIEYFKGEVKQTADVYGIEVEVTQTILFYIENGWMYSFQFSGTDDEALYKDFEKLLSSVQYPESAGTISTESANVKTIFPAILLDFLLTAFIYLLAPIVIIVSRKKYPKATIKKIMIINGICGFILLSALLIANGQDKISNVAPAFLWSGIGIAILNKTSCLESETFPESDNKNE